MAMWEARLKIMERIKSWKAKGAMNGRGCSGIGKNESSLQTYIAQRSSMVVAY